MVVVVVVVVVVAVAMAWWYAPDLWAGKKAGGETGPVVVGGGGWWQWGGGVGRGRENAGESARSSDHLWHDSDQRCERPDLWAGRKAGKTAVASDGDGGVVGRTRKSRRECAPLDHLRNDSDHRCERRRGRRSLGAVCVRVCVGAHLSAATICTRHTHQPHHYMPD